MKAQAAAIAARLSDADLVGQMLMPYAYGNDATQVTAGSRQGNQEIGGVDTPAQLVSKYRLGGLILVRYSADDPTAGTNPTSNIESPAQIRKLTDGLQRAGQALPVGMPLLLGTDQEHGAVTRIRDGVTLLPSAMAFGAAGNPALTERASAVSGAELAALGINVDFAPVADVTEGVNNAVIGSRSYGSNPTAVGAQVAAAVRGYQRAGVATSLKHFPGHGHTGADSHAETPVLSQSFAELMAQDIAPFQSGIQAGALLVMSGHLDVQAVDPGVPATLSRKVLVDLLRGKLGFQGVVITDAMNMAPVADRYSPAEAAVRAVLAGNDILLMPPNLPAAQRGLLDAMASGRLPRAQVVESVTRILALKLALATQQPALNTLQSAGHQAEVAAAASAAITVLRGPCTGRLVQGPVTITGGVAGQRDILAAALRKAGIAVTANASTVVNLVGYGDDSSALRRAAVTVGMDAPYLLSQVDSPVVLASYGGAPASLQAVAAVLAGTAKAPGRLPIPVSGFPASAC